MSVLGKCSNGIFLDGKHMVAMPDGSIITKEEWDERQQENSTKALESASNESLIEEFVDTIMAGCHHETTGNFDGRGFCRNKSIEVMSELVARRIMVSTTQIIGKE